MKKSHAIIIEKLKKMYPDVTTALVFENPYQLLIATVLSAQTTDIQVNKVTGDLFSRFPDPDSLALADPLVVENIIKSIGLYKTKAKNIIKAAALIVEMHGGKIPDQREALMTLPGVGRKTANVVLSCGFNIPAIAVDTHVFRVSRRLGLSFGKDVNEVEKDLMKVIPKREWNDAHHWLIWHGRLVCKAKNPECQQCGLQENCYYYKLEIS